MANSERMVFSSQPRAENLPPDLVHWIWHNRAKYIAVVQRNGGVKALGRRISDESDYIASELTKSLGDHRNLTRSPIEVVKYANYSRPILENSFLNITGLEIEDVFDGFPQAYEQKSIEYAFEQWCEGNWPQPIRHFSALMEPWGSFECTAFDVYFRSAPQCKAIIARSMSTSAWGEVDYAAGNAELGKHCNRVLGESNNLAQYFVAPIIVEFSKIDGTPEKEISGIEYERRVAEVLVNLDFSVNITKATGDHGVDVLAYGHGLKIAVQCKDYRKPVGNKAVQEVVAGAVHYGCSYAVVCGESDFTEAAKTLAHSNNVLLLNLQALRSIRAILEEPR